jgi:hypothetical protein
MEKSLFTCDGTNECEDLSAAFYNPVLVVKIGDFKIGTRFKSAVINYTDGYLILYPNNSAEGKVKFKLKLVVQE